MGDVTETPVGVATVMDIGQLVINAQSCAAGLHAWVPWLRLDSGSWLTWCAREGCDHREQFDG